jgi:uncharacterized membrane protein YraQ (UPF0718 family)
MDFDQWGPFVAMGFGLFVLACLAVAVFVWYKIVGRTGYHPALAFLMIVPLANVVLLLVLAFSDWPIQREVEALRRQATGGV